jgi:hypothetical protein
MRTSLKHSLFFGTSLYGWNTDTLDFKIQYFVCPPLAVIQATQRRRIERIMFWIILWGILFPSNNAWRKVAPVVGLTGLLSTRLPNTSQACFIGAICGDSDGQCIQLTFCACKKFIETLAVCGRAGRSLNLDGLETLEQHKEPGFHLYSVVR